MIANKNMVILGAFQRPTSIDISYPTFHANQKLIIYLHGFKSFSNWGFHPYIANELAKQGNTVLRLNFSHNGVGYSQETCNDFVDLEAFGNNNFSKELQDVAALLAFINETKEPIFENLDRKDITIIGHSRGGGIAILAADKFDSITKLITFNSVSNFDNLLYGIDANKWRENGVHYIENARTKQQMPLYYQLYEDYVLHKNEFDILAKVAQLKKPFLCIHAMQDETVKVSHAYKIKENNANVILKFISNSGHTFGVGHPMTDVTNELQNCLHFVLNWINL